MTLMDAFHESRVTRNSGSREVISRRAAIFSRATAGKVFPATKKDPARRRGKGTVVLSLPPPCDRH